MQPIIKWTGSKRSQAKKIVEHFPREINVYCEPFVGSAAVLYELMEEVNKGNIKCNDFLCSDINSDLIDCWRYIKYFPNYILMTYTNMYDEFSVLDIQGKKDYYKEKQKRFNELKKKLNHESESERISLFFWLRRTCYNGLVRYNKKGEFNSPCHFTRNGIEPYKLQSILFEWSHMLNKHDVKFICCSYDKLVDFGEDCFCYLDPPYANTKGMYNGDEFDNEKFYKWLDTIPHFALSYDGKTDETDNTQDLSDVEYKEHIYLNSGKSSFSKFKDKDINVQESLYIK